MLLTALSDNIKYLNAPPFFPLHKPLWLKAVTCSEDQQVNTELEKVQS